jgi:hypothetical protein
VCLGVAFCAAATPAQNQLTNGPGPGTVTVRVDGWGCFGGCGTNGFVGDAQYTTSSGGGPFPTTCFSAILMEDPVLTNCANRRHWIAINPGGYPAINLYQPANPPTVTVITPGRHVRSSGGTICGYDITVDQILAGPDPGGAAPVEGTTLHQIYTLRNAQAVTRDLNLYRYLDGDFGPMFTEDRGGASRRREDCFLPMPPWVSNKEWIFEYAADVPGGVIATSIEGIDHAGNPVLPFAFEVAAGSAGHPVNQWEVTPGPFLTNNVQGDTNRNLLSDEGTGADMGLINSIRFTGIPAGGTVVAHFRTRWSALNPSSAAPVQDQARDVTCSSLLGNYSGLATAPLLAINGHRTCVDLPPNSSFTINMCAPAAGPNPAHYIIFVIAGSPTTAAICGDAMAADFALWGPPVAAFGLGAFPVSGPLGLWSGGHAAAGFALASSIPGAALLLTPPATGMLPNALPILTVPTGLPAGIAVKLQAAVVDAGAPSLVSITNALRAHVNVCQCELH